MIKKGLVASKLPSLTLPVFDGSDLDAFLKAFDRWLVLSGAKGSSDEIKLLWLIECATPKVRKLVEKIVEEHPDNLVIVLTILETLFPKLENDLSLRIALEKIP